MMICNVIGLYGLSVILAWLDSGASAFAPQSERSFHRQHHPPRSLQLRAESTASEEKEELLQTIRSMRVKELKAELEQRTISTADAFEKEELVQRLYKARLASPSPPKSTTTTTTTTTKEPSDENVIRGELSCISLDSGRSIEGQYNSESIRIENADVQTYPILTLQVNNGAAAFPLKLLLDTACSGLLLTPATVQKHNLPKISMPVSTTGAGGTADASGFATQLERFTFSNHNHNLGPLPAVVQDTGVLEPLGLDGIIGLSFLGKYACTELDLETSEISLYKTDYRPPFDESHLQVVAEGELSPTRLGIWTVDTCFTVGGQQGKPIKMLVDTGSTTTILSWKGLQEGLGLMRNSPQVQVQDSMGSMGLDNVAMSLTHKIEVDGPILFGRSSKQGLSIGPTTVDIGDVAVVDTQLAADNVAGILGMNILSKASMIRMVFSGPIPRITIFQKKKQQSSENSRSSGRGDTSTTSSPSTASTTTTTTTRSQFKAEIDSETRTTTASPTSAPEEKAKPRKKKKRRY